MIYVDTSILKEGEKNMTLGQLLSTLMLNQPIILCWKGNKDIEILCKKTTVVPKRFEDEQVNRIYVDDDDKLTGYPMLLVELKSSLDIEDIEEETT